MPILTKEVEIKLWGKTVKYYNDLGYDGKHGDVVSVKVEDLSSGSNVRIQYLCDYCQKEILTIVYADYMRRKKEVNKMACRYCAPQKMGETCYLRYGADSYAKTKECHEKMENTTKSRYGTFHYSKTKEYKEKFHKTCVERYGESYRKQFINRAFETFRDKTGYAFPSQSPDVRKKITTSYINHYGVDNPQLSAEVREKTEKTNLERYGCIAPSQNEEVKEKARITNINKYGVQYTMQSHEFRERANETLCKNGTQKTSKQQVYLHGLYGGEINYSVSYYAVDIYLPKENLVIEYDGGGHNLKVVLGRLTQEQFNQKEIIRYNAIKYAGYKQMRLISSKDLLPSDQILLQMLDEAKLYFSEYPNHSWIEYDIDKSIVRNAENKDGARYDYGSLRKIKDSDLFEQIV